MAVSHSFAVTVPERRLMPSQDFVFVGINVRTWDQLSPLNNGVDGLRRWSPVVSSPHQTAIMLLKFW